MSSPAREFEVRDISHLRGDGVPCWAMARPELNNNADRLLDSGGGKSGPPPEVLTHTDLPLPRLSGGSDRRAP